MTLPHELNQPWYAGSPSFLRAPWVDPSQVPDDDVAIVGCPTDAYATSHQRTGARWGPRRIREATARWARTYASTDDSGVLDPGSGQVTALKQPLPVVDTGDATIVHHDVAGQIRAIADHTRACSTTSGITVSLGGDHFVAYPAALGVIEAWRERKENLKVGYLQVDAHTDFLDERLGSGRFSHATMARRISEIPEVTSMAWLGLSSSSEPGQFEVMRERGFRGFTADFVREVGATPAIERALDVAMADADILYVSLDIDAANNSDAPGTGSYVYEGITAADYLDFARGLAKVPALVGLDLCEVAPTLPEDGGWRTALLASSLLTTALGGRLIEVVDTMPIEQVREVFPRDGQ